MFKPSSYIGIEYRAYGKTEGHGDKIRRNINNTPVVESNQDTWNREVLD